MKSLKRGRGPSMMDGVMSVAMGLFGLIWTVMAARMGGGLFALFGVVMQAVLFLLPNVDSMARWVLLLYCALPPSYIAPGLGKNADDNAKASGVCSILTALCLVVFCLIAIVTA